MPKILYLAENLGGYTNPSYSMNEIMHHSGHNVGNFAFWYAASKLFDGEVKCLPFGAKNISAKDDIDFVFIPAANFLNATADLGWLADIIVELDKPCIVVGLGAQSEQEDKFPELKEGTIRFVQEAAKRTPFLALRGPYSEKLCARHDVQNTRVLGCPSVFTNPDRKLGQAIAQVWDREVGRVAVHASSIKAHVMNAERFLFSLLGTVPGSNYIVQRPVELMKLIRNMELDDAERTYIDRVRNFLAPDMTHETFTTTLWRTGNIPYSSESWRFYLRGFSHSLGTRIHGAMLSIAAGLPTICITHDTRTRELCSVLKVPNIGCNQIKAGASVKEIFASTRFDADDFEGNRSHLAGHYLSLFSDLGLVASKHLKSFQ